METSTALVVMAKQPRIGFTKTRLCPPFSPQQAAEFYEAMLLDTFALVCSLPEVQLAVAITPATASGYFEQVMPQGTLLLPVAGADIGECLAQATGALFTAGFRKVIALNSDGPSLPRDYLLQAINLLEKNDVVLGPGEDGGYYLIGLKSPCPELFQQINWSTSLVLKQTLARLKTLVLHVALTPIWYDVDTIQEVARLATELVSLPPELLTHTRCFFEKSPFAEGSTQ
jgi:rSAM/selenodomain-associated transferase 1